MLHCGTPQRGRPPSASILKSSNTRLIWASESLSSSPSMSTCRQGRLVGRTFRVLQISKGVSPMPRSSSRVVSGECAVSLDGNLSSVMAAASASETSLTALLTTCMAPLKMENFTPSPASECEYLKCVAFKMHMHRGEWELCCPQYKHTPTPQPGYLTTWLSYDIYSIRTRIRMPARSSSGLLRSPLVLQTARSS